MISNHSALSMVSLQQILLSPVQLGPAPEAEMLLLLIQVFHIAARTHNTYRIAAVDQSIGMTQLVNNHLAESPSLASGLIPQAHKHWV